MNKANMELEKRIISLSASRTRAILSSMEDVEVIGTNTNRKYKLKNRM